MGLYGDLAHGFNGCSRKKIADAKNFITYFIRSRMALNRGKNCFKKEGCTSAIFVKENELICIVVQSFMTQVSIESS